MTPTDTSATRRNPAELIADGVERTLELASTWVAWDGRPRPTEDGTRLYTPNKVIRRQADHLIDHLAEVEALLAGRPTEPDHWHASAVTLGSDMAEFTEADLNEARERLRRLARSFALRYEVAGAGAWDQPREPNWSLREIAEHLSDAWYAEQVGDLREAESSR
jgi:2'-5' RNA ligase